MNFFYLACITFAVSFLLGTINIFKPNKWLLRGQFATAMVACAAELMVIWLIIEDMNSIATLLFKIVNSI